MKVRYYHIRSLPSSSSSSSSQHPLRLQYNHHHHYYFLPKQSNPSLVLRYGRPYYSCLSYYTTCCATTYKNSTVVTTPRISPTASYRFSWSNHNIYDTFSTTADGSNNHQLPSSSSSSSSSTTTTTTTTTTTENLVDIPWIPPPQFPLPIITPPPHIVVMDNTPPTNKNNNKNFNTNHSTSSSSSSSSSVTQQIQHFMNKHLSISYQQNIIIQGESLFQSAWQQSNLPEWYGPGRIGRDFRSRHAVLTFHIWLLHKRLLLQENLEHFNNVEQDDDDDDDTDPSTNTIRSYRKDYNMCQDIDLELFNIFWDNTTCRIRALNVYELSVNKHLQNVQKYTFLHLVQYDHCYTGEMLRNPTERLNYLRELVVMQWLRPKWIDQRNKAYDQGIIMDDDVQGMEDVEDLYRMTCHHIDRIVHYIDVQYQNIVLDLPYDHFTNGHVQYVPLPQFANLHDVSSPTMDLTHLTQNNTTDGTTGSSSSNSSNALMENIPFLEYPDTPVPCHAEDILPHPWVTNITNAGKIYYWNPTTRVSSWIRPTSATTV